MENNVGNGSSGDQRVDPDGDADDGQPSGGGVVTYDYTEDGPEEESLVTDLLPDWLWAQHSIPPPQEHDE